MKQGTFLILFSLFILFDHPLTGQESKERLIGFEAGFDFLNCKSPKKEYIRGDRTLYGSGNAAANLSALGYTAYAGIKREFRSSNDHMGILTGLRFTKLQGIIGKDSYMSENASYFFMLYKQDGLNTEYIRIKSLVENSYYLGVPFEIRLFPYKEEGMRLFVSAGTEFNFLLKSGLEVNFYNDAMKDMKDEIAAIPGKPNSFESRIYAGFGFCFERESKPDLSIEFCFPSLVLTKDVSGLVDPITGVGFQLNMQFPF
jgi:hypothetical protein